MHHRSHVQFDELYSRNALGKNDELQCYSCYICKDHHFSFDSGL